MNLTKLKRVAVLRAGGTPAVQSERFWREPPDGVPWVAIGDMSDGGLVRETARHVSAEGITDKRLPVGRPGTVLFAMYASVGAVAELAVTASWNQALLGIQPVPGVSDRRFVRYWMEHLRPALGALARSNTQANLNAEQVGNLDFPVLPVATQRAIADYLDTETSRIDTLITKKRRMIELLEERSRAAVVKRLGAIKGPVVHLRHVARIYSGSGFPISYQGNDTGDYPFFKVRDLASSKDGRWIDSAPNWVDRATARKLRCRLAPVGSVLFPKVGAALLGNQRRIAGVMAAFDNNLMAVTSSVVEPRYLRYALTIVDLGALANPGPVPSVNEGVVGSLSIKVPSPDLQVSVADELDAILDAHGRLTSLHELEIRLLVERRQALVTAAVTGELILPTTC